MSKAKRINEAHIKDRTRDCKLMVLVGRSRGPSNGHVGKVRSGSIGQRYGSRVAAGIASNGPLIVGPWVRDNHMLDGHRPLAKSTIIT